MRKPVLRAIGLGTLIALLVAVGGYTFSQYAHAQAIPPTTVETKLDMAAAGAWLGLLVAPVNEHTAKRLDIPLQSGVAIVRVVPDGPAAKAGAQAKDVITTVGNTSIADMPALKAALQAVNAGDVVQLTVRRPGGSTAVLSVTTATVPSGDHYGHHRGAHPMGGFPFLPGLGGPAGGQAFENSLGGQFSYKDGSGQVVTMKADFGKVKTATDTSVTITLNRGGEATFTIATNTKLRGKGSELRVDDRVVAVTRDGSNELTALIRVTLMEKRSGSSGPMPQGESHRGRVQGFPRPIVERLGEFPMLRDAIGSRIGEAIIDHIEHDWTY